jgi:uncharacterized protein YbjQ (UPF0145 family)
MTRPFLPDRPVDERQSLAFLEQGGLPIRAQRRIYELTHSERPIFTSTLNVSETVVARATGLTAISQVMGSSVFHVGYVGYSSWGGGELEPLTNAHMNARSSALGRMRQEAMMLGAHLVLDVKFEGRGYEWASDLLEITAVGTAVRIDGAPPTQDPVLTMLEADQLYKLHRTGYWPVGIALGGCFYYSRHTDCYSEGSYFSSELTSHSAAVVEARDLAIGRFRAFAKHFKADGVVGTRVHRHGRDHEYEVNDRSHTAFSYEIMVAGTAIVRKDKPVLTSPSAPRVVVDLRDV